MAYIVAVDDGHGLKTAGKRSPDNYLENEFNHYTKIYLKFELKRCGFKMVDCSPSRKDNSLPNRVKLANDANADIFVSIHFNAMGSTWQKWATGIETFYHGGSSKGKILAEKVQKRLMQGTKMQDRGIKSDKSIYTNGFYVLRYTKMAAILTECGFMDNREDRVLMESDSYKRECSKEICQGICDYFNVKYIPEKKETKKIKSAEEILKEVSNYSNVWIPFVEKHQKDVNIKGLIQLLYYTKGK